MATNIQAWIYHRKTKKKQKSSTNNCHQLASQSYQGWYELACVSHDATIV